MLSAAVDWYLALPIHVRAWLVVMPIGTFVLMV